MPILSQRLLNQLLIVLSAFTALISMPSHANNQDPKAVVQAAATRMTSTLR